MNLILNSTDWIGIQGSSIDSFITRIQADIMPPKHRWSTGLFLSENVTFEEVKKLVHTYSIYSLLEFQFQLV